MRPVRTDDRSPRVRLPQPSYGHIRDGGARRAVSRATPQGEGGAVRVKRIVAFTCLAVALTLGLSACAAPRTSSTGGVATSTAKAPYKHVRDANCADCHKAEHAVWATSLHAAAPSDVLLNVEHNKAELLVDECIKCHAPFQVATLKIGDIVQPLNQKGPWKLVDAGATQWQAIRCEVCHDVTLDTQFKLAFYDGTKGSYVAVSSTTDLCEKCHVAGTDDSRDLKGSVHQGLQCVACHLRTGMNIDPHDSCSTCHPAAGPKGHPDVTTLDTTFKDPKSKFNIHFVKCTDCHTKGIPPVK
jgi:hypothetical protein